jgi:hypothetical protein
MKKYTLLLFITGLIVGQLAAAQDYIITWQNDTIACKLPGNSKTVGIKPGWKYQNGYERILTVFANDSIRVINAGEIKGYSRKEHGKKLLCDGIFEAKKIALAVKNKLTPVDAEKSKKEEPWYFLNRVVQGKYASLYIQYSFQSSSISSSYYISRHGIEPPDTVIPFFNKKKMIELLSNDAMAGELANFNYRKSTKGLLDIVNEYNRLKEEADKK